MPLITPEVQNTHTTTETQDPRLQQLRSWLQQQINYQQLHALEQDASFRRYFRVTGADQPYIVMDAPPEKEPSAPFAAIAQGLKKANVNVPELHAIDLKQGFLLLTDFGNSLYLQVLNQDNAEKLYNRAQQELLKIQQTQHIPDYKIPEFSKELLSEELENFRHWYLKEYCGFKLSAPENKTIDKLFKLLIDNATTQPQVFTHRDYHSRNLMLINNNEHKPEIGILDFQDAVWGPVTYDLVSMLRDCYVTWPQTKVESWVKNFYNSLIENKTINVELTTFMRWFDLMGMQRHLKAIFIFARKYLRDHDKRYLEDIPRGLQYIKQVCEKYPELKDFYKMIQQRKL